jgi:hypothetical protein
VPAGLSRADECAETKGANAMTDDHVRKYVVYVLPLIAGAVLCGFGIGGCIQYAGPESMPARDFWNWPIPTQIDYLKDREEKRAQHEATPKSELASPIIFVPLILVGIIVVVAGVCIIVGNESS